MSIKSKIVDPRTEVAVNVSDEGLMNVITHPYPPRDATVTAFPFREYLTDSTGSNDMRVNGSTTNQSFYVEAREERDLYINRISFVIADAGATLREFGAITALSNGCEFRWSSKDIGDIVIHESLKSNFDFIRLCSGEPAFGTAGDAFKGRNVQGASEGYIPVLDFSETFGLPWGIRLRSNTFDRLELIIKDNTSAVDEFDAIVYGAVL